MAKYSVLFLILFFITTGCSGKKTKESADSIIKKHIKNKDFGGAVLLVQKKHLA